MISFSLRIFLTISILGLNVHCFAQKENNNWFFGNGSAVSFNTPTPTLIQNSKLYTDEGSAVVSDSNGNLLFYTDGVTVWNKKHEVMQGGIGLSGHKSATQSATIVPHPSNVNLYYIFTITEKGENDGLKYSIIDISKENSLGEVIQKNTLVITPVSEKLVVAQHQNKKDFWIITHKWNSDEFCTFLLSSKGVTKAPVISKVGAIHKDLNSGNKGEAIGYMKISPNQKKLAVAITYRPNQPIEVFDFDNKTGKISNVRNISTSGYAYGLEFSPDNTKLYVSFLKGKYGVIQYDLEENDIFENGTTTLSEPKGYENYGALQLGPDDKIYVAKTGRYVDVIQYPNKKGVACGYKLGYINLRDKSCVYGLPPKVYTRKIESIDSPPSIDENTTVEETEKIKKDNILCAEIVELDAGVSGMVYLWSTGSKTQKITVTEPGTYSVVISHPDNVSSETQTFNVSSGQPKVDLGEDQIVKCVASIELDAKNRGLEYKWSTGSKNQTLTVYESGRYSVTVSNGTCSASDEVKIEFVSKPPNFKALTSFSPQNKSFNSFFDYSIQGINEFELTVKNSKGKTIFKTTDSKQKWNGLNKKGESEEKGDYSWIVKYKGPCTNGEYITKEGVVKLY